MKKLLSITLTVLLLLSTLALGVFAEDLSAEVYVTIADENGKLVLAQEKITVTDIDGDSKLTINDALYCAHEAKFEGGASAGYGSALLTWGLSLTKLWGVENGGSYGYYVNDLMAMGLGDEVKSGDRINAFIYTDTTTWSDTYCYFDVNSASVKENGKLTLTLNALGFDKDYNQIEVPVKDAVITLDGVATEFKTDENGKVTLTLDKVGSFVISATSASQRLVPPALTVEVSADIQPSPNTGDATLAYVILFIAALFGAIGLTLTVKKRYEI